MLGHLVPCGGGRAIPLPKPRLVLGPRRSADADGARVGHAELRFEDGYWSVRRLPDGAPLRINEMPCDQGRLLPEDIISVGANRYRIVYTAPGQAAAAAPPRDASHRAGQPAVLGVLVPCGGGPAVPLKKPRIVIGRADTCDVILPHRAVSAWHCGLEFSAGHWRMLDLDSSNGTFVDGVPFRRKWLFPGSILGVAVHRFRMEYFPQGERPSAADDDVAVLPTRSLMESVGLTRDGLEKVVDPAEAFEEAPSPRRTLESD